LEPTVKISRTIKSTKSLTLPLLVVLEVSFKIGCNDIDNHNLLHQASVQLSDYPNILVSAKDIAELIKLSGLRCHQLKGNRVGQWAIKLTGFYRLIFTLESERLEIVCIEEVSKHYGD